MVLGMALAAYAVGASIVAPRILRLGPAQVRAPGRALLLWVSVFGSGILALVLGFAATIAAGAAASASRVEDAGRPWLISAFSVVAAWGALGMIGAALALVHSRLEPLMLGASVQRGAVDALIESSTLSSWHAGGNDVVCLTVTEPMAFSLGGRNGKIMVTSGLVALLQPDELNAVIAHEKSHLRGGHQAIRRIAQLNRACLPTLSAATTFDSATRLLIELVADDHSVREIGRAPLHAALSALADATGDPGLRLRASRLSERPAPG